MQKKPTTKNQVLDSLQWSSKAYEDHVFTVYWNWCMKHSPSTSVLQQLIANAKINHYFLIEYHKYEQSFVELSKGINPNNIAALEAHYETATEMVMKWKPKALLDEIKTNPAFVNFKMDSNLNLAN